MSLNELLDVSVSSISGEDNGVGTVASSCCCSSTCCSVIIVKV